MLDLLVKNARTPDSTLPLSFACQDGKIVGVGPAINSDAIEVIDAGGRMITPPMIDCHFHMDATLSYGLPRVNESGTLLEGIGLWGELKPLLTYEALKERAHELIRWSIAKGTLAIRTHVDVCDPALLAVDALLDVRKEVADFIDIQLVAFPQDGFYRDPKASENLVRALDKGVDVVGGIPHFERTMADGAASVKALCEIAEQRGLLVDMHCDETDDPMSRHIESLAYETKRLELKGRVAGSHLTSMHSMDNYYVSKLLPLILEAEVHAIANPLINITLQGRHDTYPKRRGLTRVKEMTDMGINVAFGHDCVMDPWYSFGSHDMLEVAHMGLHVGQMTSQEQIRSCFNAVTRNAAKAMHLEGYGLAEGCNADFVLLQANSVFDAIRIRPPRLAIVRRGKIIARTPEVVSTVKLDNETTAVTFELNRTID